MKWKARIIFDHQDVVKCLRELNARVEDLEKKFEDQTLNAAHLPDRAELDIQPPTCFNCGGMAKYHVCRICAEDEAEVDTNEPPWWTCKECQTINREERKACRVCDTVCP